MSAQRIVVVEDDPGTRETLKCLLELEGYAVHTAGNGQEGLQLLHVLDRPCLVFLDLMMPVMDGWEFLELLRRDPDRKRADLPVAVVSAAADVTDVGRRYSCTVLRKPVDVGEIVAIAQEHCGCAP